MGTPGGRPVEPTGRIDALDGLRAVAIVLVIARHCALVLPWPGTTLAILVRRVMDTGWIGVDIFFVLSGFLITGILVDARGRGPRPPRDYFRAFYARRALRIFPVYYLFLGAMFFIGHAVVPEGSWWYWTYLSNILFARDGFRAQSHVWSLAVEEQFYLVWPTAIRWIPRRWLPRMAWGMVLVSSVLRVVVFLRWGWRPAYVLTVCRLDEFAAGGLLALRLRDRPITPDLFRHARTAACLAGGALVILVCTGRLSDTLRAMWFESGIALTTLLTVALIALAMRPDRSGALARVLRLRPLRSLGQYSYTIYLVHVHIGTLVALHITDRLATQSTILLVLTQFVVTLVPSWAVGWVSWRVVERPVLRLKRYFPMPRPAAGAA